VCVNKYSYRVEKIAT